MILRDIVRQWILDGGRAPSDTSTIRHPFMLGRQLNRRPNESIYTFSLWERVRMRAAFALTPGPSPKGRGE